MTTRSFWSPNGAPRRLHPFALFAARRGGPDGGNPFGGNPFRGNPFGGNPFDGLLRHRGRARRGDVRAAILFLLLEQPRNGYQLMQEMVHRSQGRWRPSPGSVYPALQQLEDEVLVRVETAEDGKLFHLTDRGVAAAREVEEQALPWSSRDEQEEPVAEFGALIHQIALAASQVAQAGTQAQWVEASKLLTQTRRELYRILARDDE